MPRQKNTNVRKRTGIPRARRLWLCAAVIAGCSVPQSSFGERIVLTDGRVIEGAILSVEKGRVFIRRGVGTKGIGIHRIESIANDDGSVSKYDYKAALSAIEAGFLRGDYAQARALCDSLLAVYPDAGRAHYLRAVIAQKNGEIESAIADYSLLVGNNMADAKIFNNLAALYALRQDFGRAREFFARAIREEPGFAGAHRNLADVYMRTQDFERAREEYAAVIALEPADTGALYNLGVLCARRGDFARAKKYWEDVLAIDPHDSEAKKALEQVPEGF